MKLATFSALAVLSLLSLGIVPTWGAEPSLREVYQAVEAGNLKQAESMMEQVLRDHPTSAKAHFVKSEILAKEGRLDMAGEELATAERLAPGLPFAKPEAVRALNTRINALTFANPVTVSNAVAAPPPSFPWGMLLLGAGLIAAIVYFVRSRNRATAAQMAGTPAPVYGGAGTVAQPYGSIGPSPMGPAGGPGSGLLGSLATGAAVGAGVVAGEMLMHKIMDGGHHTDTPMLSPNIERDIEPEFDAGGTDFGVNDAGSWDDSSGGISDGGDWN